MSILLFILILVVLIVGHEFGHFLVAKLSRMKVFEFGIGFPPKLWGKEWGGTEYSLNWLPFGGFVRIYGEDEKETLPDLNAFGNRPRILQAAVIFAGPFSNIVIAFLLLSIAYMVGVPSALDVNEVGSAKDVRVMIADVLPESPAALAGVKAGDVVTALLSSTGTRAVHSPEDVISSISGETGTTTLVLLRAEKEVRISVHPVTGLIATDPTRPAIGIASALVGTVTLSPLDAIKKAVVETYKEILGVVRGLYALISSSLMLSANLSDVAGPVGIASLVKEAAVFGLGSVLSFAAMISVNLAVVNLLPFPALDGGRLAILGLEAISRRRVPLPVVSAINLVGFVVLIALMLAITAHDITKIFF